VGSFEERTLRAREDPAARRRLLLLAAGAAGLGIAVLAVLGTLHGAGADIDLEGFVSEGPYRLFNTDGEVNVPTAFSGLLLFGAAFLAAALARSGCAGDARPWWFMAGVLAFMGLDECLTIHEKAAWLSGVTWQAVYVPVALVAFWAWLRALGRLRAYGRAWLLWIGGAAAWATALVFERIGSDLRQGDAGIRQLALSEEILEMIGSTLFGLALLRAALEAGALVRDEATRRPERPAAEAQAAPGEGRPEARAASGER
jgi:hypothetical protein